MGNKKHFNICILWIVIFYNGIKAFPDLKNGLIAFDCTDDTVNITSFSLVDVELCKHESDNITTISTHIQVVQAKKIFDIHVYKCKVIFKRRIQHCGMHSHTSTYQESFRYIVREFTSEECRRVHETGSLRVHNDIFIHELQRNNTKSGEVLIIGQVVYSTCYGGPYFDGVINYKDALVTYEYEVELFDYTAKMDFSDGTIKLRGGLSCVFNPGFCLDSKEGYITWDSRIDRECNTGQYSVIYEGPANKTFNRRTDGKNEDRNALFSALSKDQLFSIRVKENLQICGYPGYESDHNQIFILETSPGTRIIRNTEINVKELDLMTYFNSKMTVVEHHLGNQLTLLYLKMVNEICKVEKSLLETRLISARIYPQEFASNLMKSSGYTAVIAGEVIYIIQCKPAYVTLAPSPRCYQEIPVAKDNVSMYMSPVTHVLQRTGTQIECTPLLPAKFKFGTEWYSMDGRIHRVPSPNRLSTEIETTWKYDYLPDLMAVGIYDEKNLKRMHDMIYESEDRRSSAVVVHRTLSGNNADSQRFDFSNFIDENVIESTINKYWSKFMNWTTFVGQVTSSLVGFWLIGKLLKFVIDSLVHCRILFDIYGASWKLLAAFWDSLTNLLTHEYHNKQVQKFELKENGNDIQEETEVNQPTAPNVYPVLTQPEVTIQISTPDRTELRF